MKRLFINLLVLLFISCYKPDCQIVSSVDKWMEYIDELAEETEDEERIRTLYSDLSYLVEHPFDLNSVNGEQLGRLPFLSDLQIGSLLDYRSRYGRMVTLYELKNVEHFDMETISLLIPFVYISDRIVDKRPFTVKNLLKYGSNELIIRYDKCFQQKKGYGSYPDSILELYPNRKYLGESFYHSLRYSFSFDERLQMGFVAEKDAGEPFWNVHHKGYDYYSVHLFFKDINKVLKSLAIGDYKVSFGQGLVVSTDYTPGRGTLVTQAERRNNGFRRHYSTNENDFFRGMATTVSLKKIDISLFYSYRKLDASTDSNRVTSFKTDGLHRLIRDMEKKQNVRMQTYGGNIRYATPDLCIGLTGLAYTFGSFEIQPDPKPYNLFYFRGRQNMNVSVDYMLKNRRIKFFGETAFSANGAVATLNALQLTPASYFSLLLLHRYYDRRYQAYFGNAFAQGSAVQNEQGVYAGFQWTPAARWKLSAYADLFRFPWLKYGIDAPSSGKEYMVKIDYSPAKNMSFYFRYKQKQKDKNQTDEVQTSLSVRSYQQHRLRFQLLYESASSLLLKTSAEGIFYTETKKRSRGYMIAQSIGWKPVRIPFQADLYVAYFRTDDYYTRIGSYEKNILYAFNMPSLYGKGLRFSLAIRKDFRRYLSLSVKYACTYYPDRDVIGTDLEEINGHSKMDLYALIRWKF